MLNVSAIHTMQRALSCGIMIFLAHILAVEVAFAGRSSKCTGNKTAVAAVSIFDEGNYTGAAQTLLEAKKKHRGLTVLCFFNLIAGNEIDGQAYHQFGLALYEVAVDKKAEIKKDMAFRYLAGSELSLRRALVLLKEDEREAQVQLDLAKNILEQVRNHDQRLLQTEAKRLLESYIEKNSDSAVAAWVHDMIRYIESLISSDHEFARYMKEAVYPGGDVLRPETLERNSASYSDDARLAKVQGRVIIQAVIDQSGAVVHVTILKGLPMGLNEETIEVLKAWKFKPATKHGEPVMVVSSFSMSFQTT